MRLLVTGFLTLIIFIQMSAMRVKIEADRFIRNETECIKFTENAFMHRYFENIVREMKVLPFEWQDMQHCMQDEGVAVNIPMRIGF